MKPKHTNDPWAKVRAIKPEADKASPWARLDAMFAADKEPTGPEWFTLAEFMERYGLGYEMACKRVERLKKGGTLEQWLGYSKQHRRRLAKYRLTQ